MCHALARCGSGTEARLSARQDGAGADDSSSECLTVAHARAKQEQERTMFLILTGNWVILYYFVLTTT